MALHRTHQIIMTHEQLRVITYALKHADMSKFRPRPEDDIDAQGSAAPFIVEMAESTLEEKPGMIHGWAI